MEAIRLWTALASCLLVAFPSSCGRKTILVPKHRTVSVPALSTIEIQCKKKQDLKFPEDPYWYHNNDSIHNGDDRREVFLVPKGPDTVTTKLIIHNAMVGDSGNYTCQARGEPRIRLEVTDVPENTPRVAQVRARQRGTIRFSYDPEGNSCKPLVFPGCYRWKGTFRTIFGCKRKCVTARAGRQTKCIPARKKKCCQNKNEKSSDANEVNCGDFLLAGCKGNKKLKKRCKHKCIMRIYLLNKNGRDFTSRQNTPEGSSRQCPVIKPIGHVESRCEDACFEDSDCYGPRRCCPNDCSGHYCWKPAE